MDGNNAKINKRDKWVGATIRNRFRRLTRSRGNKLDSHSTFHSSDNSLQKSLTDLTLSHTGSGATSTPKPVTDITLIPTGSEVSSVPGHKSTEASVEVTIEGPICVTPKNPIMWSEMNISPTKLITIEQSEEIMEYDGIKQQQFYKDGNQNVRGAVYFLYSIGYGSNMKEDNKINKIHKIKSMVDESSGNLRRLSDFAFQTLDKHSPRNDNTRNSFLDMTVSLKLFFEDKNAFGEFLGQPFMRYQKGTNQTCWQVAVCVWISLLARRTIDDPHNSTYIVDISQRVRHYISLNPDKRDKIIEDRVIKNAGGYPSPFTTSFFGNEQTDYDKINTDSTYMNGYWDDYWEKFDHFRMCTSDSLKPYIEEFGPGLIDRFRLTEHFIAAAKKERTQYGYWAFLGDSIDDEGKFVPLEAQETHTTFRKNLLTKFTDETDLKQLQQKFGQCYTDDNTNEDTQTGGRNNGNNSLTTTKGENFKSEENHCMVLLGGKENQKWSNWGAKKNKKQQQFYLCLNSWHEMPLVVVSQKYLTACGAQVTFRKKPVSEEQKSNFALNENCLAMGMASPSSTCKNGLLRDLCKVFEDKCKEETPCVAAPPTSWNCEDEGDY